VQSVFATQLPLESHALVPLQLSGSGPLVTTAHAPVFAKHVVQTPLQVLAQHVPLLQ
jgi:hypothetical protein